MKISKNSLKIIIENFLLEDENGDEQLKYENAFDVNDYTFEIKISSSGVDINVKHNKTAVNDKPLKTTETSKGDEKEIAKIIAGIIEDNSDKKEEMNKLVKAIKSFNPDFPLNNADYRVALVGFRSDYVV